VRRRAHVLRENRRNVTPRYYIVFDCETLPQDHPLGQEHVFRLAVAYYYDKSSSRYPDPVDIIRTTDRVELWKWIERHAQPRQRLYIFAHNIDYDVTVSKALEYLQAAGYEVRKWFVQDRSYYMKWCKERKTILLMDTFSIFPFSLKRIGEFAGLPKAQMPDWSVSNDEWFTYCERDVVVLSKALQKYFSFIKDNDLGNFAITLPGQAFNAYRHRFMKENIYIHNLEPVINAEVSAYYGGRTEAWYIGRVPEKLYYLDINSMYPYVMKTFRYPVQYIGSWHNPTLCQLKKLCKTFAVIAHIEVDIKEPFLPYRADKVIFPVGRFSGWYATPEVLLALQKNAVKSCDKVFVYKKALIFADYVDFFYRIKNESKQSGDIASYVMSKLFLNSLYGKFGQRVAEMVEVKDNEISYQEATENIVSTATGKVDYVCFAGKIYRKERREPSYNSFIGIAAHVTSYARVHLYKHIELAGHENVYYMDTDSLFVNKKGFENLTSTIDNLRLGYMKLEDQSDHVTILGAKSYIWNDKRKIKGIPYNSKEIKPGTYQYLEFMKFKSKLKKGLLNEQIVPCHSLVGRGNLTARPSSISRIIRFLLSGGRCFKMF